MKKHSGCYRVIVVYNQTQLIDDVQRDAVSHDLLRVALSCGPLLTVHPDLLLGGGLTHGGTLRFLYVF